MAGRDITIPFGPDKTGGLGIEPIPPEGEEADPFAEPTQARVAALDADRRMAIPSVEPMPAPVEPAPMPAPVEPMPVQEDSPAPADAPAQAAATGQLPVQPQAETGEAAVDYRPGGLSEEEAEEQAVDEFQMSILALKDSIDQGRELKEREKVREELAEALKADHVELADRENILANYQTLVAEQDAIIAQGTERREASKNELSQVTVALEQVQAELEALRAQHAEALQPIEGDLGRARAAADQAKNDERSRKSELNAAEAELRRADETAANTMAVAQHQQSKAAYEEAHARSDQAKEYLAQVQKAYDEAKQRMAQAEGPLERNVQELSQRAESLKETINQLGDEVSTARNRRQYCDTVYQYPDETAKIRSEVEQAESLARKMDVDNRALRQKLAESKRKARSAKIAIAILIVIIVVFIVAFIILSGR